jgi:hypothetical protein
MVVSAVSVGKDTVLVLEPTVTSDGWIGNCSKRASIPAQMARNVCRKQFRKQRTIIKLALTVSRRPKHRTDDDDETC